MRLAQGVAAGGMQQQQQQLEQVQQARSCYGRGLQSMRRLAMARLTDQQQEQQASLPAQAGLAAASWGSMPGTAPAALPAAASNTAKASANACGG